MQKFLKYLIAISLFFSVFSFSGNTENSYSPQTPTTQTELLFVNKKKDSKRIISYKKVFADKIRTPYFGLISVQKESLKTINNLIKVKFKSISKHLDTFKIANRFLQIKTIPQTTKEDIITTHHG